jgi:hypothetical protein
MSEETAWTEFEATVLASDYVGYRTDVILAALAWVREVLDQAHEGHAPGVCACAELRAQIEEAKP